MKIDSLQHPAVADNTIKKPAAKQATEARQTLQAGSAYNVSISPQAQQASSHSSEEGAMHSRLAVIREQLASSTYNISGREVATKILSLLNG